MFGGVNDPSSPSAATAAPAARPSFLDRWFRPVRVPREAPQELAELARRGSVVFVMRKAGLLNFLFLAWLLRQHGLPPLRAALGLTGLMPWLARVRASWAAVEGGIRAGETSVVFLGRASGPDPFPLLARLQRDLSRPILLVPALLVWARRPQNLEPTLGDIFFGTPDAPRRLANMLGFVLNHRHAVLRLGRAADLAAFERERPAEPDAIVARSARGQDDLPGRKDLGQFIQQFKHAVRRFVKDEGTRKFPHRIEFLAPLPRFVGQKTKKKKFIGGEAAGS